MVEKIIKKRNRVKKDLDYYKNLKKDIEKQIKELATKESVKKRKELYKRRSIIGKYFLELFEMEDDVIDSKTLGEVFSDFLNEIDQDEKKLFIHNNEELDNKDKNNISKVIESIKSDDKDDNEDGFYVDD